MVINITIYSSITLLLRPVIKDSKCISLLSKPIFSKNAQAVHLIFCIPPMHCHHPCIKFKNTLCRKSCRIYLLIPTYSLSQVQVGRRPQAFDEAAFEVRVVYAGANSQDARSGGARSLLGRQLTIPLKFLVQPTLQVRCQLQLVSAVVVHTCAGEVSCIRKRFQTDHG